MYGMVWYASVWYGMVWYCMVCMHACMDACMDVWYGMVWYGMVWYASVWYGMVWYGIVWYGMAWYGMAWYGMAWYGMVWYVCDYSIYIWIRISITVSNSSCWTVGIQERCLWPGSGATRQGELTEAVTKPWLNRFHAYGDYDNNTINIHIYIYISTNIIILESPIAKTSLFFVWILTNTLLWYRQSSFRFVLLHQTGTN